MRTKFLFTAVLGVAAITAAVPAEARINQRQGNQQQRIARGVDSGALNARPDTGVDNNDDSYSGIALCHFNDFGGGE